jgi:hypothetical protein
MSALHQSPLLTSSLGRTVEVPHNSIVISPLTPFSEQMTTLIERNEARVLRCQESFDLGDCEGIWPYQDALNQIDASIGLLKRARREMQALAKHIHDFGMNDYCTVCGADGRA